MLWSKLLLTLLHLLTLQPETWEFKWLFFKLNATYRNNFLLHFSPSMIDQRMSHMPESSLPPSHSSLSALLLLFPLLYCTNPFLNCFNFDFYFSPGSISQQGECVLKMCVSLSVRECLVEKETMRMSWLLSLMQIVNALLIMTCGAAC